MDLFGIAAALRLGAVVLHIFVDGPPRLTYGGG